MTKTPLKGSYLDIAAQLDLREDDILFIASDIKQLALQERKNGNRFDANAFIESFQAALSKGALIIPAYTDNLQNGDTFNHQKSKPTTGALSNKVFRRSDFIRTKDPLHSVFVWGVHQQELMNLDGNSSLGAGSIFEWLHKKQARMICIDVHFQNSLTYVHFVEEHRKVSYRKAYNWSFTRIFEHDQDVKSLQFYSRQPWVLTDLTLLQSSAQQDDVVALLELQSVEIQLFTIQQMHDYINKMLDEGQRLHRISLLHFFKTFAKRILRRK